MEISNKQNFRFRRVRGANIIIKFNSNAFDFGFVISNVRLDYNFLDFHSWFLKKVHEQNNCYLFFNRKSCKNLENQISSNEKLKSLFESISIVFNEIAGFGGAGTINYTPGTFAMTLPNMEWCNLHHLNSKYDSIKKICESSF